MTELHQSPFKFIPVEKISYPTVILGGDQFLDYWGPQKMEALATVAGVYEVMSAAFAAGVRGFDLSMNAHVLAAFRQLQQKYHNQVIGLANPNWKLAISLNGVRLWEVRWRVVATVLRDRLGETATQLREQNPGVWQEWFAAAQAATPLSREEINAWVFDEDDYRRRLKDYQGLASFCLVGSDYADWCIALGRIDLLQRQIACTRKAGFVPISVSHLTSLSLGVLEQLDVAGHWVMACLDRQILSEESVCAAVQAAAKPITSFQVLGHGRHADRIEEAIAYVRQVIQPRSIVIGACSTEQVRTTFGLLRKSYPALL